MNAVAEMRATIQAAIAKAQECDGKLSITFKRDAIGELVYLLGMIRSGIITLDLSDHAVVMAVSQSRDWEYDDNRTMVVTMTDKFEVEFFVGRLARALEKIEVVRPLQMKKPKSKNVYCQSCNGQMRPRIDVSCCICDIEQIISDLKDFGYEPVKTQKSGALRKMKSPDGKKTIREEAFGAELERLLLERVRSTNKGKDKAMNFGQVQETARLLQETTSDVFGLMTCIPQVVEALGLNAEQIMEFCKQTPNGEELWIKFTARRDSPDTPKDYDFKSFMVEVLADTEHPVQQ